MEDSPHLTLVSASPRRLDLLSLFVPNFSVGQSAVEESGLLDLPDRDLPSLALPPPFSVPHTADPRLWAWRKAIDFLAHHTFHDTRHIILAADTVVVARTEILAKPRDHGDALRMLRLLAGDSHCVVTGYCLLESQDGITRELTNHAVLSEVIMHASSDTAREAYIATGEPFDKAGAYALQGLGGKLLKSVRGCRTNVIGLPVCAVRDALETAGVKLLTSPEGGYCPACPTYWLEKQSR